MKGSDHQRRVHLFLISEPVSHPRNRGDLDCLLVCEGLFYTVETEWWLLDESIEAEIGESN